MKKILPDRKEKSTITISNHRKIYTTKQKKKNPKTVRTDPNHAQIPIFLEHQRKLF